MAAPTITQIKNAQAMARIAEIDHTIATLQDRRKRLVDFLQMSRQAVLPLPEAPTEREVYSEAFEVRWKRYVALTGQGVEKKAAFKAFKKIDAASYPELDKAIENYGKGEHVGRGYVRHFHRFLREDYWTAWINRKPQLVASAAQESSRDIARGILSEQA